MDDTSWIAGTRKEMQDRVDWHYEWSSWHGIKLNIDKCNYTRRLTERDWSPKIGELQAKLIPNVEAVRYLGRWISIDGRSATDSRVLRNKLDTVNWCLNNKDLEPQMVRYLANTVMVGMVQYPTQTVQLSESMLKDVTTKMCNAVRNKIGLSRTATQHFIFSDTKDCGLGCENLLELQEKVFMCETLIRFNSESTVGKVMVASLMDYKDRMSLSDNPLESSNLTPEKLTQAGAGHWDKIRKLLAKYDLSVRSKVPQVNNSESNGVSLKAILKQTGKHETQLLWNKMRRQNMCYARDLLTGWEEPDETLYVMTWEQYRQHQDATFGYKVKEKPSSLYCVLKENLCVTDDNIISGKVDDKWLTVLGAHQEEENNDDANFGEYIGEQKYPEVGE